MFRFTLIALLCLTSVPSYGSHPNRFVWSAQSGVTTLDPHGMFTATNISFYHNIYETLVRRSKTLDLEPGLATSWKNTSPTTWTFSLRQNVTFHDGTPFTADDVVFSFNRAKHPDSDAHASLPSMKSIKKIDPYTVEITTDGPCAILPNEITVWMIMSKKWCETHHCITPANPTKKQEFYSTRHTNGTGPFKVVQHQTDIETKLIRNDKWWDKAEHNLDEVLFRPLSNESTLVSSLMAGDIDFAQSVPYHLINKIEGTKGFTTLKTAETATMFLGLNQHEGTLEGHPKGSKNPLLDLRVRQAIYHAIDIDSIIKISLRGLAHPAGLLISPLVNGFDEKQNKRLKYDPKMARHLLHEAGYPEGFKLVFDCPQGRYAQGEDVAKAIIGMLRKAGIQAEINLMPISKYYPQISSGKSHMYFMGLLPGTYDAHVTYSCLLGTKGKPGQGHFNHCGYSNPKMSALIEGIRTELNQQKRRGLIQEASRIQSEDSAYIPLYQSYQIWGIKNSIKMIQRPDNFVSLRWVTKN